jgi:hypothetical protein
MMEIITNILFSTSVIYRLLYIVILILIFYVSLRVLIWFLARYYQPASEPMLVTGIQGARKKRQIKQNPKYRESMTIIRSVNQSKGVEFTWNIWIKIDGLNGVPPDGPYHIFHKGSKKIDARTNFARPLNAPGLYISNKKNDLIILMDTFAKPGVEIKIPNIPLYKWFHVSIQVKGSLLDVFINGDIVKRHTLTSVVKQNYGDVHIGCNAEAIWNGYISNLQYFNRAIHKQQLMDIVNKGPNMENASTPNISPPYLSGRFYSDNMKRSNST